MQFIFYARIARLYSQGGEFYDLTWFHQYKLSEFISYDKSGVFQGVYMVNYCYNKSSSVLLPQDSLFTEQNIEKFRTDEALECASSTMMIFSTAKSPGKTSSLILITASN